MSDLTDLQAIKSNVLARLKDLTANPKPSYQIDGQQFSWNQYQEMLFRQLKEINKALDDEQGPYEFQTEVVI